MGRRITRKQLKKDEFVSTVDRMMQWLSENWRPIAASLGAVVVVIMLWWAGDRWNTSRAGRASYLLYQALAEVESQPPEGLAALSEESELKLREVIDRHDRSEQADVARLYLARMHMSRGDATAARDLLVEVVERNPDSALGGVASLDLVELRLASGQAGEVAQELEAMVTGQDAGLPRDTALYQLAKLYARQNERDRAREYYQKLVDEFPESPYLADARQRLAELG